jgi:hypothetical protein
LYFISYTQSILSKTISYTLGNHIHLQYHTPPPTVGAPDE